MIRFLLTLWFVKGTIIVMKLTKHNATTFPGILALKLCPNFTKYIGKPKKNICVSGTNGKTTCTNLIHDMLVTDNNTVLTNLRGGNISEGVITTLITGVNIFNKCKYEIGCFETDEKSTRKIFSYIKPDFLLITNLSRDSIMRNAHPEYIRNFITKQVPKNTTLILNGDDLICSSVAPDNKRAYFGITEMEGDKTECKNRLNDIQICPNCYNRLKFIYERYSHVGKQYCPNCDFKSPELDYKGAKPNLKDMTIDITDSKGTYTFTLLHESMFNIYNVVSAVALFTEMGYEKEKINYLLSKNKLLSTRFQYEQIGDTKVYDILTKEKNAFGISRTLEYVLSVPGDKEILGVYNDQLDVKHWSENTCWLYDADFEYLKDPSIKNVIIAGERRYDDLLRYLLAGIPMEKITMVEKEEDAYKYLKLFENDNIFVFHGSNLPTMARGFKVSKMVKDLLREREEKKNG